MTETAIIQIAIVAAITGAVSPVAAYFMTKVLVERIEKGIRRKVKGDTMRWVCPNCRFEVSPSDPRKGIDD